MTTPCFPPHPADRSYLERMECAAADLRPKVLAVQARAARGQLDTPSLVREVLRQDERMTLLLNELRLRLCEHPGAEAWAELERTWVKLVRALERVPTVEAYPRRSVFLRRSLRRLQLLSQAC